MLKIAFTTSEETLDAPFESRFGRAPKFLIYDLEKETFSVIDNQQNMNASQGAGIQAATTIARAGAACLVTGHCGPKAYKVLSAAKIRIFTSSAATVKEALGLFRAEKLVESLSADVEGHWM
jgi:predicted Fe-Mo cluster-binding NifX family protein